MKRHRARENAVRWITLPFVILILESLPAADNLSFEQIFLEHGLSQSIVQCICQDRAGFMWFGTEDGLNQFDGYEFTVLRNDPADSNSLSYNNVTALCEDYSGNLWIGTFYGGLNCYNPRTRQIRRFRNDPGNPGSLSHNNIHVIYEDASHTLWIGTDNGLNQLLPGDENYRFIRHPHSDDPNSLSHNTIRAICEGAPGELWIGTDGGLNHLIPAPDRPHITRFSLASNPEVYALFLDHRGLLWIGTRGGGLNCLNPANGKMTRFFAAPGNPKSLSHSEIYAIHEDRDGNLWLGTNGGGLCLLNSARNEFRTYRHDPVDPASISYNEIRALFEDQSGLIWIGTYGAGINKVDRGKTQFTRYEPNPHDANSLNQPIVWSIFEDDTGVLWIGTHGGGLNRFDRRTNTWKHFRHQPGDRTSLSHDIVRLVLEDRAGNLWVATHGGGICRFDRRTEKFARYTHQPDNPASLAGDQIRCIYADRSGALWIGTYGAGLDKLVQPGEFIHYRNQLDDSTSLSNDFVRTIYEDSTGMLWIGTEGGGLNRMNPATGKFTHFRAQPNSPTKLNNDYIFTIYDDQHGQLWLGTWGGGLNKFQKSTGEFTHYTESDGLPNDAIYGILEDERGNLWLSTNNGLSRFDPVAETFQNYTVEDGLQSNEFNGGAYFKSRRGEMFFGGIRGFNAFFPAEIQNNQFVPPVIITRFSKLNREMMFDRPFSEIEQLKLSYRDYVFSFEFAALDFTAPEKNQYAYKMEGLDTDWLRTDSKKRFATYTTLSPGEYTFRVKGSNSDGVWNETGSALKIRITPPVWQTWWFRMLSLAGLTAVGLALGFIFVRRRMKTVRLRTELLAAHAAQMSIMPHADPEVPGFEISGVCLPANTVGGDFFDYFWLNAQKTRFGIAVGDVSGKAMESAMTAIMTSGMLCAHVASGPMPASGEMPVHALMTRLNPPLFQKTSRQMFTALCLAVLDPDTRTLVFTNAGIIEPVLKSATGVEFLTTPGPHHPLGLLPEVVYAERKVQLQSGDTLIFLTDGIPEAQNHQRVLYGDERFQHLVETIDTRQTSAKAIKEAIIADVRHFSGRTAQHDDMTLVVVKVI